MQSANSHDPEVRSRSTAGTREQRALPARIVTSLHRTPYKPARPPRTPNMASDIYIVVFHIHSSRRLQACKCSCKRWLAWTADVDIGRPGTRKE